MIFWFLMLVVMASVKFSFLALISVMNLQALRPGQKISGMMFS